MLTEDGKHLYVSYDEYHNLIEKLAIQIHKSEIGRASCRERVLVAV